MKRGCARRKSSGQLAEIPRGPFNVDAELLRQAGERERAFHAWMRWQIGWRWVQLEFWPEARAA